MKMYLSHSKYIDSNSPEIARVAGDLRVGLGDESAIARRCFEFVRDEIKHSWDFRLNPVTCVASDVLLHKTAYCYSKSHLLAALLRANNIPAGLCYQRLSIDGKGAPYSLHGLNAVFLGGHGWYRVDARGNNAEVDAGFSPPVERLAFRPGLRLEADFREVWPEPLPVVVRALERCSTIEEVNENLPDIEVAG